MQNVTFVLNARLVGGARRENDLEILSASKWFVRSRRFYNARLMDITR